MKNVMGGGGIHFSRLFNCMPVANNASFRTFEDYCYNMNDKKTRTRMGDEECDLGVNFTRDGT